MPNSLLHAVHVYPVKSAAGCAPGEVEIEPWGPATDRRWMLVDPAGKVVTQRPQPRLALARAESLPDGGIRLTAPGCEPLSVTVPEPAGTTGVQLWKDKVEAVEAGAGAHAWFSAYLDTEVRLVHLDDPARRRPVAPKYGKPGETVSFADAYPLLVTTLSSLDALNSLVAQGDHADEGPLPMSRFRPNAVVDGPPPWAEDDWKRVAIGEVTFRVTEPCARCVVTTTDQRTAERGKEPLRTLARHRRSGDKLLFGQNLVPEGTGTIRVGDPVRILE
ncbi:MOSC domain-containing protein [Streptomyces chryseus]|uniref:Molybdenum cofactor biosysynthesis protein n=1 Tax=Streptomyces chryseus TaxID=68186 RepID=A0ABQ3DL47_9ACTN|nr:MOSC N-terminal beta barrel domain-containing protein [Streptomyces chryseus]GGX21126.1 molybdenum cofactor biosysynthesis protein [Streptomyces chryseus]GHB02426.1 molybdenum cofactor biosysynthesis protein [Streptomyces chryseus]